ncbi:hypothetical protein B7L88_gp012 [Rhizobium phage RHEph10]|uniref:hypothetical protein n=1 Tax=Rhizobium phage RHEph10 TaxID=1220717 RepID=UPI0002AB144B|nr:hypothetical protein B7L88_gp012 [Rhizobium phage RHEph10]AGC36056.1 hypothetical protein RHEph10_gp012 [Rhizobium phage RHEph10]
MKRFWAYHRMADRLQAADDMRMLHLLAGVTSQEGVAKLQERLSEQVGEIYVFQPVAPTLVVADTTAPDPSFEKDKLESLRASILRNGR